MLANAGLLPRIVVLGRSRAGRALFAALRHRKLLASLVPARQALGSGGLPATVTGAGILVLAIPDRFLAAAATEIARQLTFERGVVLHLSGALDHTVLLPLARKGRSVASCHPMQSLRGERHAPDLFSGVTFGIEGQPRARQTASRLARSIGGRPALIRRESKTLYHLASALAGNATVGLLGLAETLLAAAGIGPRRARAALAPLVRRSLENALAAGPSRALTGPVARGDEETLARHRQALEALEPSLIPVLEGLVTLQRRLVQD